MDKALVGDNNEGDTPVTIPNTEVKTFSADGSGGLSSARVGSTADRTLYAK